MKVNELKEKAKALGVTPGKMKKTELIHSIQQAEGNSQCFGKSKGQCVQTDCCFMKDCVKINL
ncbi:MAG: Rho termination factor N-terminal domain-containing protein [Planctomycetota bacterium]|nr:MAG: Rho termination factor N-terminal domain-containing protein [Planctomycetota bacterium]